MSRDGKRVFISGTGCICAAGNSVDKIMQTMHSGYRNPGPPSNISLDLDTEYPVFEVKSQFDRLADSMLLPKTTRTNGLALHAFLEAFHKAGLEKEHFRRYRVGVCIGTTVGCTLNNEPFYRDYKAGKKPGPEAVENYMNGNPARFFAELYACSGPVASVVNACSSGTDAIGIAASWIERGLCDIAIAGGADEFSRISCLGFISLLISSNEPCRPFDRNRKGLNLGEGAGILILESEETAASRGAEAMGAFCAYSSHADAYHPTRPHPEGRGLALALDNALKRADIGPERIAFVNAHGTSTIDNDKVEGKVLSGIFPSSVPVVSTKSYTGHTLGAAGAIEAVLSLQSLIDGTVPATVGFSEADPECGIVPTTRNTFIEADYALSSSLAFGGTNSVVILKKGSS